MAACLIRWINASFLRIEFFLGSVLVPVPNYSPHFIFNGLVTLLSPVRPRRRLGEWERPRGKGESGSGMPKDFEGDEGGDEDQADEGEDEAV